MGPTGPEGPTGPQGDPWTAGGTLPAGEGLTGAWAGRTAGATAVGISFPLPLDNPLDETQVHVVDSNGDDIGTGDPVTECPGTTAVPDAEPGNLCIYQGAFGEPTVTRTPSGDGTTAGADVSGTRLMATTDSSFDLADGTWAVRAPE